MKKLIALLAVLAIAAPAIAAGPEWNFYGSARVYTFWTDREFAKGVTTVGGDKDDAGLTWGDQGQSRIGAKVKADKVSGHFEFLIPMANSHDGTVVAKQIYGTWKFMDNGSLTVGKDNAPSSQFISRQVYGGDLSLLGFGTTYGRRPFQIKLGLGGFELALIEPNPNVAAYGGDVDIYLPKFEAAYKMKFDMFNFGVMGGFQTYNVDAPANDRGSDVDVNSYIVGADLGVNVGAFYVKAAGSYGQNWTNARWNDLNSPGNANAVGAFRGATDNFKDTTSYMAALVAGLKITDAVTIEAGAGYRVDDNDLFVDKDKGWNAYVHATIALAKNVYILPEVGYFDFMDNAAGVDEGKTWYAGARWQIDF